MLTLPAFMAAPAQGFRHLPCPGAEQLPWCHMTSDPFRCDNMLWQGRVVFVPSLSAFGKLFCVCLLRRGTSEMKTVVGFHC